MATFTDTWVKDVQISQNDSCVVTQLPLPPANVDRHNRTAFLLAVCQKRLARPPEVYAK